MLFKVRCDCFFFTLISCSAGFYPHFVGFTLSQSLSYIIFHGAQKLFNHLVLRSLTQIRNFNRTLLTLVRLNFPIEHTFGFYHSPDRLTTSIHFLCLFPSVPEQA